LLPKGQDLDRQRTITARRGAKHAKRLAAQPVRHRGHHGASQQVAENLHKGPGQSGIVLRAAQGGLVERAI